MSSKDDKYYHWGVVAIVIVMCLYQLGIVAIAVCAYEESEPAPNETHAPEVNDE